MSLVGFILPRRRATEMVVTMRSRGFTLIELLVTLAIMSVLMAAVSPSLLDWMVNLRIRNATNAILNGLQLAHQDAIRRNESVGFWLVTASAADPSVLDNSCALSAAGGSWVVSVNSPVGSCTSAPSTTLAPKLVASHAIGDGVSGVTVAAVAADGASPATSVIFNGIGRVTNAGSVATVDVVSSTNAGRYRSLRIQITSGGSMRMCDPALSAPNPSAC